MSGKKANAIRERIRRVIPILLMVVVMLWFIVVGIDPRWWVYL